MQDRKQYQYMVLQYFESLFAFKFVNFLLETSIFANYKPKYTKPG